MSSKELFNEILKKADLRVTPQRLAVLETVHLLSHPTAEEISNAVSKQHPSISTATIYNVLETFVEQNLLNKVKTDGGAMVYDSIVEKHHHIYIDNSNIIEDYHDDELDHLLEEYFKKKNLSGITVKDVRLQIHAVKKDKNNN